MIRMMANSLGKAIFEYSIDETFPYDHLINVVAGSVQGGFLLCFNNLDQTSLS